MRTIPNSITRRHLSVALDGPDTGKNPYDAPETAWPPVGKKGEEERDAQKPIEGIGNASGANITTVPTTEEVWSTAEIKNWKADK